MKLSKKRIRNTNIIRPLVKEGSSFVLGVKKSEQGEEILERIGLAKANQGECILPPTSFGPISLYNAEGKYIPDKSKPMETAYKMMEWRWEEWRGRYEKEEKSRLVERSYKRYPREFFPPPSIELSLCSVQGDDEITVISPVLIFNEKNEKNIVHAVNLFLEIFGECQFFTEEINEITKQPVKKLNWEILPKGKIPWEILNKRIGVLIHDLPAGNQPFTLHRMEIIKKYGPDFTAIGRAGFRGYIIFGFEKKNLFILESLYYGNATYVFEEQWEHLSKLTKAEILNKNLQKERIIHRKEWKRRVNKMFS